MVIQHKIHLEVRYQQKVNATVTINKHVQH